MKKTTPISTAPRPVLHRPLKVYRRPPKATIVSALLLITFFVVLAFAGPPRLPVMMQRLVGLTNALLAALVVVFAVSELGKKYKTFKFLRWKRVDTGRTAALGVFALVFGWWFTPLAPIKVGQPAADDIARWLTEEIAVVVLNRPSDDLATVALPSPPPQAFKAAGRIPPDAGNFALAIKAIAESRFGDADQLMKLVEERSEVESPLVQAVRGQIELFAGRIETAPQFFQSAVEQRPDDFSFLKQATAALAMAGEWEKAAALARRTMLHRAGQ